MSCLAPASRFMPAPVIDWAAFLDLREPPKDRPFWAVTEDGEAVEVAYLTEAHHCTGHDFWARNDDGIRLYEAQDLLGWSDCREDAEEAAELYLRVGP